MKAFKGCEAKPKFLDTNKKVVKEETVKIGDVDEDSSNQFATVKCAVPGKIGDKFYVEIEMADKNGNEVSANDYMFLVADQAKDLEVYKKYGVKYKERITEYGYATNRYFPGLFDNTKSMKADWINVGRVGETKDLGRKQFGVVED